LMRLAIIAGMVQWSLSKFSLIGPVFVILLATVAFKTGALLRMKRLLEIRMGELLPWRNLAALIGVSAAAAAVALALKSQLNVHAFPLLLATSAAHFLSYALLVWRFDLLSYDEQRAISGWVRRTCGSVARVVDYRKG
jgi:hypothetical protein